MPLSENRFTSGKAPLRRSLSLALTLALCLFGIHDVHAAQRNWQATNNGSWSNTANWSGGAIGNDDLNFSNSTQLLTTNDATGGALSNRTITFTNTAGAYTLTGSTAFLNANNTVNATVLNNFSTNIQTINLGLSFFGANTFNIGTVSNSIILNGVLSGTNITKSGASTLFLNGTNNFVGVFTNTAGAIRVANDSGLGTTNSNTVILSGAALELITNRAGGNISIGAEALSLAGTGINSAGALRNITGSNTYGGLITITNATRINSDAGTLSLTNTGTISGATFTLTFGGAGNVAVASIISNTTGGVTKDGAGTLFLTASNRFTGNTTINAGTIAISNNGAFGSNSVIFASNGTRVVALTGLQVTNNFSLAGNGTMDVGGNILTNTGVISNTGILTKAGAGTLILGRANTYRGGTTINEGTIAISNGASFGSNTVTFASNSTTVAALASILVTNNFALTGNGTMDVGGNVMTNSGAISGAGSLTKAGAGTLILSASNTYTGTTTISAGTLLLSNAGTISTNGLDLSASGATLNISNIAATTVDVASFTGATGSTVSLGSKNMSFGGNNASTTFAGAITGSGNLTKNGTGTTTLSGANTYTGSATVAAGTLRLNNTTGSALGSITNVTVASDAVLLVAQSNQVNNSSSVSLSGGTIRTGAGVTETFGNLNVSSASFLDFGATFGNASSMNFGTYTPSSLLSIDNFNFGSTLTFKTDLTSSITNSSLFAFSNGGISSFNWNAGTSTFTITAIPEPSTVLAAAGLLGLMLWPSRRRILAAAKGLALRA